MSSDMPVNHTLLDVYEGSPGLFPENAAFDASLRQARLQAQQSMSEAGTPSNEQFMTSQGPGGDPSAAGVAPEFDPSFPTIDYFPRCEFCGHTNPTPSLAGALQGGGGGSLSQAHSSEDDLPGRSKTRRQQNEELDYWLFQLKEQNPSLPWAKVAEMVQAQFGEAYQIPTLQMRFKRHKIRMESRLDDDESALKHSVAYWEHRKWEIVAEKLHEARPSLNWSPRDCQKRWLQLELRALEYAP